MLACVSLYLCDIPIVSHVFWKNCHMHYVRTWICFGLSCKTWVAKVAYAMFGHPNLAILFVRSAELHGGQANS